MAVKISALQAFQILDSRGKPTLEVEAWLTDGTTATAQVPSGVSTGRHEAKELRDVEDGSYEGQSVFSAISNVNGPIAVALRGLPADNQELVDQRMIEIDGTSDKSNLGANAILGVSCAVARAAASHKGQPLWRYLAGEREPRIPLPMINILSGGLHAGKQIEFQDFLAVPHGFETLTTGLEAVVRLHGSMHRLLEQDGHVLTGVADEGGWGPRLKSNEQALEYMVRAIELTGYKPGEQVSIAIDAAATHFYQDGKYNLQSEKRLLTAEQMIDLYAGWLDAYPIVSIEDAMAEDDWEGWKQACRLLGSRCKLIGDDLLATNPDRLERAIEEQAANAVLVKMNQIGTLTETMKVVDRAHEVGFQVVFSARSGDTEDSFLADLAVASGAGHVKIGSVTRSERLAKYNRLLRIESNMSQKQAA